MTQGAMTQPVHADSPVNDIAACWPEVSWPYVNVLCEGPSIKDFDRADLLKGPIVAVNRAIALQAAPAHFWATTDDPRHLWAWSEPYRAKGLRYFTTDTNLLWWQDILGETGLSKVYSVEMTDMKQNDENDRITTLPTIMPLLCWLLRLKVQRVRIFGCDMSGIGGSVDGPGYVEWLDKPERSWDSRWHVERVLLAHVTRLYRTTGARVERWAPLRRSRPEGRLPAPS